MKLKSVSGLTLFVKDLHATAEFYEGLGFEAKKRDQNHVTVYMNWFWIDFLSISHEERPEFAKEKAKDNKGAGVYIYLSVEDVDAYYEEALTKGLQPETKPRDWPNGNREFVIKDPDGYKLVVFKRK